MKRKSIAITLVIFLLSIVLSSNICCTNEPAIEYDLAISSTAGGNVTDPGEGTFNYDDGEEVSLVATPDTNYHFVNWTGDVDDIDDVNDATTTIIMNDDYTIVANFGFDMTFIDEVPDTSQPPTATLATTIPSNYCAPMAMVNILGYWDAVMGHSNAENLTAFQQPPNLKTVAEYLGWFMNTNAIPGLGIGSPPRVNPGVSGTYDVDIGPGTSDFVRWDATHIPPGPLPPFPAGKLGYDWVVTPDIVSGLPFYTAEIDAGRPLVTCFSYWNPVDEGIAFPDPETGETIDVFSWGDNPPGGSHDPNPEEYWTDDIGHAVTGVGYILNWDPDGDGTEFSPADYVIVHDNWSTTPENVAIPWANWNNSSWAADPGPDA
jgi:hypothetical protein